MKIADIDVQYIDHMGSDQSVVNAARVSFDKKAENYSDDANRKLISYLATHNHWSPFAHAFASFRVKAPIFVSRQLVKHSVGMAYNEVSRRYVSSDPEFYLPSYWRKSASNVKQGSSSEPIETISHLDIHESIEHALKIYTEMIEEGYCAEQARMILPQNTMTEWIWSGSLYAFARVCNLRLDSHTQRETQKVAQQISNHMKDLFPASWETLVKESNDV